MDRMEHRSTELANNVFTYYVEEQAITFLLYQINQSSV